MLRKLFKPILMEENDGSGGEGGSGGGNNEGALGDGGGQGGSGQGAGTGGQGNSSGGTGGTGGNSSGAGSGDTGGGNSNGGTQNQKVQIPENWQEILPDEIKNEPSIKLHKTVDGLAKALINAQKLIGADKIAIPKNPDEKSIREIHEKLGLPKEAEKYQIKASENSPIPKELVEGFQKAAFEMGLLPSQAEKVVKWMEQTETKSQESVNLQAKAAYEKNMDTIKAEWGEAYNENVLRAKAALREFGASEEDVKYIKQNFGANPAVLRLLAKAGATLAEDKVRGEGSTGSGAMTPSQALAKIGEIKANLGHAYYNPNHSDHSAAKLEMKKLYEFAYAGKKK